MVVILANSNWLLLVLLTFDQLVVEFSEISSLTTIKDHFIDFVIKLRYFCLFQIPVFRPVQLFCHERTD